MPPPSSYLDDLVPAGDDADLRAGLARDAARRLRRAVSGWRAPAPEVHDPAVLSSGALRTWLASVEDAAATLANARRAARRSKGSAAWSSLLDQVADLGMLPLVAPGGAVPRDFPRRVERLMERQLERLARSLGKRRGPEKARVPTGARAAFEARVPRAISLLGRSWPEAERMVRSIVELIVPIEDPGVVSYSSAKEPGIAYVHVTSAPAVRLAEDLLHEATHMRVHAIESLHPLVATGGGEEARFYSPWRREWRPLRGILHGACTFTVGAAFFERALLVSESFPASRRLWLARRFLEEMESTRVALRTLSRPAARKLLTPAGRRLLRSVARARASLLSAARRRESSLPASERRRLEAFRRNLATRPFRSEVHRLGSR